MNRRIILFFTLLSISLVGTAQDFELHKTLNAHTAGIHNIRFSPDGKILASCGYDNNAILWDGHKNPHSKRSS